MKDIYLEVLNAQQKELLPLISSFKDFYLAGGTSLALQLGHRESIDFDMFSRNPINHNKIIKKIGRENIQKTIIDTKEQLSIVVSGVNLTFLEYPFDIETKFVDELGLKLPSELAIGAMKAYAIGRRAKWKDYVDMYFLINKYSLDTLIEETESIFQTLFSEKNFREQLCYFKDIDFSEEVNYLEKAIDEEVIKQFLCKISAA